MLTTEKLSTGYFKVLWNGVETGWFIYNGSIGMSGLGGNVYGIANPTQDKRRVIGTLQQCKKSLALTFKNAEKTA